MTEALAWPMIVEESDYSAGDVFTVKLKYDWNG